jgi:hypothetical protein
MTAPTRLLQIVSVGAALASCMLLAGPGGAGDNRVRKAEVRKAVQAIADDLEKGDRAAAKKRATGLAARLEDDHQPDVWTPLRPRRYGGIGVGDRPKAIQPDGIELKLLTLEHHALTPTQLKREAAALERMAFVTAAVGEVALVIRPQGLKLQKGKKAWADDSEATRRAALELAAAARSGDPRAVQKAAARLNSHCVRCHIVFGGVPPAPPPAPGPRPKGK